MRPNYLKAENKTTSTMSRTRRDRDHKKLVLRPVSRLSSLFIQITILCLKSLYFLGHLLVVRKNRDVINNFLGKSLVKTNMSVMRENLFKKEQKGNLNFRFY